MKPFSLDYDLIDKGIFLAGWYVSYLSSSPFFFHCQLMCHLILGGGWYKKKFKKLNRTLCQMDSEPWIGSPVTSRKMIKSDGSIRTSPSDHADPDGTDPLSFHCQEREVIAALWDQPHAMPSTLGAETPRSSLGCLGSTPGLERGGQITAALNPTS